MRTPDHEVCMMSRFTDLCDVISLSKIKVSI